MDASDDNNSAKVIRLFQSPDNSFWESTVSKWLPDLQVCLPPLKLENESNIKELNLLIQKTQDDWAQVLMLLPHYSSSYLLHSLLLLYINSFHSLVHDEVQKQVAIYDRGQQIIYLMTSGRFKESYSLMEALQHPRKGEKGRPAIPLWIKIRMAYDFVLMTDFSERVDAWNALDEIAKKYKRIDLDTGRKKRIFSSGSAVRRHLIGLPNLPGNKS